MSRVLALANLDFEYELAAGNGYRPNEQALRTARHWRHVLSLLPEARQAEAIDPVTLAGPGGPREPAGEGVRLVAWGVTPGMLGLAARLGVESEFPKAIAVRRANDKLFSHEIEQSLGIALAFSRKIDSLGELEAAVGECPHDWVLKHPFGVSARERAVGRAGVLSVSALGWARGRLAQGWTLLFEPWVEKARSYSMHFEIAPEGQVRFLGHCHLLTDAGGVYRGNRVLPTEPLGAGDLQAGEAVCLRLASCGYWGLVGIDALRGWLAQTPVSRPLVEINARCSFGRLTLALSEWVPSGWSYLWWHPRKADLGRIEASLPHLPAQPARLRTGAYALPFCADPKADSGTAVLLAPDPNGLAELERDMGIS